MDGNSTSEEEILFAQEEETMNEKVKKFLKWYFFVDLRDWQNYAAIILASYLFWWAIKTLIKVFTFTLIP